MLPDIKMFKITMLLFMFVIGLTACTEEEEEEQTSSVACNYQVSKTSCGGSTYSSYTSKCSAFSGITLGGKTPTQYCQGIYPSTDSECIPSCCTKYRFRSVSGTSGGCSGSGMLLLPEENSVVNFEISWDSGDVDLKTLTPMRNLVSRLNTETDGCHFAGDDLQVANGLMESVQCKGNYLAGEYQLSIYNNSADTVVVQVKATLDGESLFQQLIEINAGEYQDHFVLVQ